MALAAWLRRETLFLLRFALLCIALAWVLWLTLGAILEAPASDPVPADAVVVLGEDPGHRYLRGRELIESGYADRLALILPLPREEQDARRLMPPGHLYVDTTADSTWTEALVMRRWMEANGIRHVLVVSDGPHMLRVAYSWRSVFRGSGLKFTLVAAATPGWSVWRWWLNESTAIFAGMEVLKLLYYIGRFRFGFGQ